MEFSNIKINTNLVIPMGTHDEPNLGLFLVPSSPLEDIGYLIMSSNQYGKFEYVDPFQLFSLNDLHDVIIQTPTDGQILQYSESDLAFRNYDPELPNLTINLEELADVEIKDPSKIHILARDQDLGIYTNESIIATTEKAGIVKLATQIPGESEPDSDTNTDTDTDTDTDVITSDLLNEIMGINFSCFMGIELVGQEIVTSPQESVDLVWENHTKYHNYFCILDGILPKENNDELLQRITQTGGRTWDTTMNYETQTTFVDSTAITNNDEIISDAINHHLGVTVSRKDADCTYTYDNIMFLMTTPQSNHSHKIFISLATFSNDVDGKSIALTYSGSQYTTNNDPINGIQWFFKNGPIQSGIFSIYRY